MISFRLTMLHGVSSPVSYPWSLLFVQTKQASSFADTFTKICLFFMNVLSLTRTWKYLVEQDLLACLCISTPHMRMYSVLSADCTSTKCKCSMRLQRCQWQHASLASHIVSAVCIGTLWDCTTSLQESQYQPQTPTWLKILLQRDQDLRLRTWEAVPCWAKCKVIMLRAPIRYLPLRICMGSHAQCGRHGLLFTSCSK